AGHPGHLEVRHDAVRPLPGDHLERRRRVGGDPHVHPGPREHRRDAVAHEFLVVDYEHTVHRVAFRFRVVLPCTTTAGASTGRRVVTASIAGSAIVTTAPPDGWLSIEIVPPCASTIRCAIA